MVRIGPGVKPPRIIQRIEPTYSSQARDAGVQGTVLFELVVDEHGKPTDITIISPLGFGLDERAHAAIEQWTFQPATKDGQPVKIRATIEVTFQFQNAWYDAKAEERRKTFNIALHSLRGTNEKSKAKAVENIRMLSQKNFPAAMYVEGVWLKDGTYGPKDPEQSLKLLTKSADKNYGPAMCELGKMYVEGSGLPLDLSKGWKLIREAAVLGSIEAQYLMGVLSENEGKDRDEEKARRYFRLCAAAANPHCQFRLGQALLSLPTRREHDYLQAIAWLELASDQGLEQAHSRVEAERSKLTAEQLDWVKRLKPQLTRKP